MYKRNGQFPHLSVVKSSGVEKCLYVGYVTAIATESGCGEQFKF